MCRILCILFALSIALTASARQGRSYADSMVDELRLELSDLKHELHSARVEITLLEEKLVKQERVSAAKNQDGNLEVLNKRIDRLEKILEKAAVDMRTLNSNESRAAARIQELEGLLALQEKKLDEVSKLKNTLAALSKAIGHSIKASTELRAQTYHVKAGDSLEKIARAHNTTVDAIRQLNQLPSDTIRIGQQLTIACDEHR